MNWIWISSLIWTSTSFKSSAQTFTMRGHRNVPIVLNVQAQNVCCFMHQQRKALASSRSGKFTSRTWGRSISSPPSDKMNFAMKIFDQITVFMLLDRGVGRAEASTAIIEEYYERKFSYCVRKSKARIPSSIFRNDALIISLRYLKNTSQENLSGCGWRSLRQPCLRVCALAFVCTRACAFVVHA